MEQVIDSRLTFAGVALLLASVGIYGVLSYVVRGRSPNFQSQPGREGVIEGSRREFRLHGR